MFGTIGYLTLHLSHAADADINSDTKINIFDFSILAKNWTKSVTGLAKGDITGDGLVNIQDLSALAKIWGYPPAISGRVCGNTPTGNKIDTVVVIAEENRKWSYVGGVGFGAILGGGKMPYIRAVAAQCGFFQIDTEVNKTDNSIQQYVGAWTGYDATVTHVSKDCIPSLACSYTGNNIFRVFRNAGIPHREYVENVTVNLCSGSAFIPFGIIPELYMWDATDKANCGKEVLPISQFSFADPPAGFSFINPSLCNNGHDCSNGAVDQWLATSDRLPALFNSSAYKSGKVLLELWWDEDAPRPNLFTCWSCKKFNSSIDPKFSGESLLWLNLLGAPSNNLGAITSATDIRPILGTP